MAKYLKTIFQPTEARKTMNYNDTSSEEEHRSESPMDFRKNLSISRSGKMRQAQKKRLSLHMDIYGGEEDLQQADRRKAVEYHVSQKTQARDNPLTGSDHRRRSRDSMSSTESGKKVSKRQDSQIDLNRNRNNPKDLEIFTPEQEIDSAFEVIDKTL